MLKFKKKNRSIYLFPRSFSRILRTHKGGICPQYTSSSRLDYQSLIIKLKHKNFTKQPVHYLHSSLNTLFSLSANPTIKLFNSIITLILSYY